jgi:hypothetical protein
VALEKRELSTRLSLVDCVLLLPPALIGLFGGVPQ